MPRRPIHGDRALSRLALTGMLLLAVAAPLLAVETASVPPATAPLGGLRPGETAVADLLTLADLRFAADPANGGTVAVVDGRLCLGDTTAGRVANLGSRLTAELAADAPLVARINQVLAAPLGGPPVWFACAIDCQRVATATRVVGLTVQVEGVGDQRPWTAAFTGDTDLRRVPAYAGGAPAHLDPALLPALRFAVVPAGGARRLTGLRLHVGIRVDGDSTPETIAIDSLAIRELRGAGVPAGGPLLGWSGAMLPPAWLAAADSRGWRVAAQADAWDADAIVLDGRLDDAATAAHAVAALDRGATLIVALGAGGEVDPRLRDRLPCNPWSFRTANLRRGPATAAAAGLAFAAHWDLHLPFAPIEEGLHRYLWQEYDKPLANTDWRVLLAADDDAGLPLALAGCSGPGHVVVLATGTADAGLLASRGATPFVADLLDRARPAATAPVAASAAATAPRIAIARHQSGKLSAQLANPGDTDITVVAAWQVSAWSRALLAKASMTLVLPAHGSVPLALDRVDGPAVDDGLDLRRVRVAVLRADRGATIAEQEAVVSTAPPVALRISEDPASYGELKDWALTAASENWLDGRLATRVIYRPGAELALSLAVGNGLVQLAPLAVASDRGWPENPSSGGLNDLSYSFSNLRDTLPLQGGWSGRPAAEQVLALRWDAPVTVAVQRLVGYGPYRRWDRSNPDAWRLLADGRELAAAAHAVFADGGFAQRMTASAAPLPPTATSGLELHLTASDPTADREPRNVRPANCSLLEWECLGWPGTDLPPVVSGTLVATLVDPVTGSSRELLRRELTVAALAQEASALRVTLPRTAGPQRIDVRFTAPGIDATTSFPLLVVPDGAPALIAKGSLSDKEWGLLCSPGWVAVEPFATGMRSQTTGWGGDDDKIWAGTRNLMEVGSGNREKPETLFAFDTGFTHYTNPWRSMPNGRYSWDWEAERLRARTADQGRAHVVGSDRWNGISIGVTWGWGELIAFDEHLRAAGGTGGGKGSGTGLVGRTRGELTADVRQHHGDEWQRWSLERYADALLRTQADFAAEGKSFTFETHGSFPLCGGDLGAKLARTHIAVGTDVFWDLHDQDLLGTLGQRFAVIAANPDLRSGAYGQWGWDNSELNRWWFANNGGPQTARRQWLMSSFLGRVDLSGAFAPYTVYGFGSQGDVGTRMHPADIAAYNRTALEASRVRPDAATGFGLVASWAAQERRMGPVLGGQGFALEPAAGEPGLARLVAGAYRGLVQAGLPFGFVTSTHGLRAWHGTQPLVQVDAYGLAGWELDALQRLNAGGAPLLAIGADGPWAAPQQAAQVFGAHRDGVAWIAEAGVERVELPDGVPAFVRGGAAPVVFCPAPGGPLPPALASALTRLVLERCGRPLALPVGMACTPFISQGRLHLALADFGDRDRAVEVTVDPAAFAPALRGRAVVAVDVDSGQRVAARTVDGRLVLSFTMPASGGRLLLIAGAQP